MSNFSEMRKAFNREVVAHAVGEAHHLQEAFPLGSQLPMGTMQAWLTRFRRVRTEFSKPSRLVNHFLLGADPEFIFEGAEGRANADHFHLKQGLAFGEDNNGRLCEIRPHPDRSALRVVASIVETFRWLYILYPSTASYSWVTGPYVHRDGLGGHVHLGRKRPNRANEVSALDAIAQIINGSGVYNKGDLAARQQGDARGQRYGLYGDIRLQNHGYEYRTFASWLDNPDLAFLMLTLSKLSVYDPSLPISITASTRPQVAMENLLAYYRDKDDDARLAYIMLRKMGGFPRHIGGDFRSRWGIPSAMLSSTIPTIKVIPRSIPPADSTVEELFQSLLNRTPLLFKMPMPSWKPLNPPEGYQMIIPQTDTLQQKGLGELVWDLCCHAKMRLSIYGAGHGPTALYISSPMAEVLPEGWKDAIGPLKSFVKVQSGENRTIQIGSDFREGPKRKLVKHLLTCGLFPIWEVSKVKAESFAEWQKSSPGMARSRFDGKLLYQNGKPLY